MKMPFLLPWLQNRLQTISSKIFSVLKKMPTWQYCTCNKNSICKPLIGDFRVSRCVKNARKWVERIIYHVQQLFGWFEMNFD
jgi:hypothetical protein